MRKRGVREIQHQRSALEDDQLCALAATGDLDAVAELANRHRAWLVALCTRQLHGDVNQAEDVAQECLIKFHSALVRDHRPLRPRAWLSVVARNACIDIHRRSRADLPGDLPEAPTLDADPFEADPFLAAAWEGLSDRHRDVLHHRELMGLRYDEIAALMGISVTAVEALLYRARGALRRSYRREGGVLLGCGLFGMAFGRLLEGSRTAEFDSHLAACVDCAAAAQNLAVTTQLLRTGATRLAAAPPPIPWAVRVHSGASGLFHRAVGVLHHVPFMPSAPASATDVMTSVAPWVAAAAMSAVLTSAVLIDRGEQHPTRHAATTVSSLVSGLPTPVAVADGVERQRGALMPHMPTTVAPRAWWPSPPEWRWRGPTKPSSDAGSASETFEKCREAEERSFASPSSSWRSGTEPGPQACDRRPECPDPTAPRSSVPEGMEARDFNCS